MSCSIVTAISQDKDTDILEKFRQLSSAQEKTQTIEAILKEYREQQSDLVKYRYLIILERLLHEVVFTSPITDSDLAYFVRKYQNIMPASARNLLEIASPNIAQVLSTNLKSEAARYLKNALISLCPTPDILATSIQRTWSFRNSVTTTIAPVRLDLGMGGVSDIPPYSLERYGNCLNVPIRINGEYPLQVTVRILHEASLQMVSKDLDVSKCYGDISEMTDIPEALMFHREALRFFMERVLNVDISELFSYLNGGLYIETFSRLPVGTGLGVSTLLLCAVVKALGDLFGIILTPQMLFASSVYLENAVGIGGGWEDATALYSGIKLMESFPAAPLSPQVRPLRLATTTINKLREQILLIHTGIPKRSQISFDTMLERYSLRDAKTMFAIRRNNDLNHELAQYLVEGNLPEIGQIMQSQWENWKILTDGNCTNQQIDYLFSKITTCTHGARMNGAGQGGCAMFVIRDGKKDELLNIFHTILGDTITLYHWEAIV